MVARSRKRLSDFAAYTGIGLAVGATAIWLADRGVSGDAFARWGGLTAITAIVFGSVLVDRRRLLNRWLFWTIWCACLAVHVLVFTMLLQRLDDWKAIWWAPAFPIEVVAINAALRLAGLDSIRRTEPAEPKGRKLPSRE